MNMKKEKSWDFKGENTKEYTHGFHTYPAMMIPQIARKLIKMYGKNAKVLLDPFCGSGTSIVEASLTPHIREAYGFDLNPLAILISKSKTTKLDNFDPTYSLKKIMIEVKKIKKIKTPHFKNIDFWFKPKVIKDLTKLKITINKIKDKDIKDFFFTYFSETIRNASNTRNSEFKLYRMPKDKLEKYNPNVFKEFKKICLKNLNGMEEYVKKVIPTKIYLGVGNSMHSPPIASKSIDIIVTSPPYGDSKTTVAYGQFSRLALQWLDYEEIHNLDNELLGGVASKDLNVKINSPTLKKTIKKIAKEDEKRAREVLSFYNDFDKCVSELNRVIVIGGHICFVVGNRTVKGIQIPTDKIMVEMFKSKGRYKHIKTYRRNIPNKRMPIIQKIKDRLTFLKS
ncbi:hypothetical protein ES703_70917 [subsurface metagenome]